MPPRPLFRAEKVPNNFSVLVPEQWFDLTYRDMLDFVRIYVYPEELKHSR